MGTAVNKPSLKVLIAVDKVSSQGSAVPVSSIPAPVHAGRLANPGAIGSPKGSKGLMAVGGNGSLSKGKGRVDRFAPVFSGTIFGNR